MLHVIHTFFISSLRGVFFLPLFAVVRAKIPIVTVGNISHVLRNEAKEANNQGS